MDRRAKSGHYRSRFFAEPLEGRVLLSGLSITYNTSPTDVSGLSTLSYNGVQLINTSLANKQFQINRFYTLNADGTYNAVYGGSGFTPSWNNTTHTLQYTYYWGTITCQYVQLDDTRLNMIFTVSDAANTGITLGGVDIYPAAITFPSAITPSNETQIVNNPSPPSPFWSSVITYGTDGPAVEPAQYSTASMALANDSPAAKSMYTALWTYSDVATNHDYYMFLGTGPKDSMLPPGQFSTTPLIYTNTGPGQQDTFSVSLRFGAAGTDPMTLAPDVEAAYATAYPDSVNWPDRRPIASLHITSPPTHSINPEGWLNNVNTDFTSNQAALNNFASQLLSDAQNTVTVSTADNAQGVIVWDVEGQRWPQATTYIGDPSLATSLYPNATDSIEQPVTLNDGTITTPMAYNYNGNGPLIDQFFAIFRNAGLRTGMTIRPTVITFTGPNGNPQQTNPVSPQTEASVLETKIQYALSTWGCTIFYLDSNTGFDRDALAQVEAAYPQVLIIPEHSFTSVYGSTAPYGQLLTYDFVGTPADVRLTYPNAFSVIYPADGDAGKSAIPDYFAATEANVALGDIILFRGWFTDAYNTTMTSIYDQAVPSLPATPTGLTATPNTGAINLSWNAVTGTGIYGNGVYDIKRSTSSNGTYTTIAYNVFGTTYSDTTTVAGTQYFYEVSALNGRGQGSNSSPSMGATNATTPAVTVPSAAHIVNFIGATGNLAVVGGDSAGESALRYTWSSTSTPGNLSQPTFSANGTNATKYVTATFHQLGTFVLTVTIADAISHLSVTSSVTVVVSQVAQTLSFAPLNATVAGGNTLNYAATAAVDQFGNAISSPTAYWSSTGGGTFSSTGAFSANQSGGTYTVTALSGFAHPTSSVTVVPTIFTGTTGTDSYTLRLNPSNTTQDQLVVSLSGSSTVTYNIAVSQYPSLTISPSSGVNSLTVDFSNGNPLPAMGVNFTGGANSSSDALYIHGSSTGGLAFSVNATAVTYAPDSASPISYSNVDTLEFDLSGGDNSLTQSGTPGAAMTYNAGSGSNTLTVNAGSYAFSADPQIADGSLTVNANAAVVFNAATAGSGINVRHLAGLNVGATGNVSLVDATAHTDRTLLITTGINKLSITPGGVLDLNANDLMVQAGNMGTIDSGIRSTTANNDIKRLTTLGIISSTGAAFDGQPTNVGDVLIKYTYYGDADLSGKVDASDYSRIDNAFVTNRITPNTYTGWYNGDFNYDGVINGSDYTLIDNAYNTQSAILSAEISPSKPLKAARAVANASVFQNAPLIQPNAGLANASIDDLLDGWENHCLTAKDLIDA